MTSASSSSSSSAGAGPNRRASLTPHDWKVLGSFGLLALALSMYDAKLALYLVGVASAVVVVRNADKLGGVLS
jgi:hypothetical protein